MFLYMIGMGDETARLDYTRIDALDIYGGSIQGDQNGIDANLTLPVPGAKCARAPHHATSIAANRASLL